MAHSFLFRRSADITLGKAELIGIWLESIVFGFEALTFVYTIFLLHGTRRNKIWILNFAALITMFALSTIHVGSNLRRILNAFVSTPDDPFPDPEVYLIDFAGFLYRFKNTIILIQIFMLDALLTYRCYIIWDKRILTTLLPLIGVIAYLVTAIGAIHSFVVYEHDTIFTGTPRKWVSASLSITFVTKIICSVLVVTGTLVPRENSSWRAFIRRSRYGGRVYKTFLLIIETGAIAFVGTSILLPTYLVKSNAQETMLNTLSSLTGEAFALIFVCGVLRIIPGNGGQLRSRQPRYDPNQSALPSVQSEFKPGRTSSNSVYDLKAKKPPGSSCDMDSSEELSTKTIPLSPDEVILPTVIPKAVHTAPFDSVVYNVVRREVDSHSQQRHPFALASPVSV